MLKTDNEQNQVLTLFLLFVIYRQKCSINSRVYEVFVHLPTLTIMGHMLVSLFLCVTSKGRIYGQTGEFHQL